MGLHFAALHLDDIHTKHLCNYRMEKCVSSDSEAARRHLMCSSLTPLCLNNNSHRDQWTNLNLNTMITTHDHGHCWMVDEIWQQQITLLFPLELVCSLPNIYSNVSRQHVTCMFSIMHMQFVHILNILVLTDGALHMSGAVSVIFPASNSSADFLAFHISIQIQAYWLNRLLRNQEYLHWTIEFILNNIHWHL